MYYWRILQTGDKLNENTISVMVYEAFCWLGLSPLEEWCSSLKYSSKDFWQLVATHHLTETHYHTTLFSLLIFFHPFVN